MAKVYINYLQTDFCLCDETFKKLYKNFEIPSTNLINISKAFLTNL